MSDGARVPFDVACELARHVAAELGPHVERIKAAGSLRRRRPAVGDIEFVVEPRTASDLFGAQRPDIEPIRMVAAQLGAISKGGERYIQIRSVLGSQLTCELYLVHPPAQWGSILAIRTGPAALGHLAVMRMIDRGLRHIDGHVETSRGELVPTPREEDFFAAAGLPCLPPHLRDTPAAMRPLVMQEGDLT